MIFGNALTHNVNLDALGADGFTITGPSQSPAGVFGQRPTYFGERLAGPGDGSASVTQDVNGDGLADIVLGAAAVTANGRTDSGAAYVIFGQVGTSPVSVDSLGSRGFVVEGARTNEAAGHAAAIVGDVNRDSYADVLLGAPGRAATDAGSAYIVFGGASPGRLDLAARGTRAARLSTGAAGQRFGADLAPIGDSDSDGADDFAVASRSSIHVVRRTPQADAQVGAGDGYVVAGPLSDDVPDRISTARVATIGDVSGDGRADLVAAWPDTAQGPGRAYVVHSPEGGRTLDVRALPGQRGVAIALGTKQERAGAAVTGYEAPEAPNGDETASVVALGAPEANSGAGRAQVVRLPAASLQGAQGFAAAASEPTVAEAAAAEPAAVGPFYRGKRKPFEFTVRSDATYGYRVGLPDGKALYGDEQAFLPRGRKTAKGRDDELQRSFAKLATRVREPFKGERRQELDPAVQHRRFSAAAIRASGAIDRKDGLRFEGDSLAHHPPFGRRHGRQPPRRGSHC